MAPRMSLANVTRGKIRAPLRVVAYGPEGVGKSTWAADAPDPIFLGAEDGTRQLSVARFAMPENWNDALAALGVLKNERHDYKSLVLDTLDWLEALLHKAVARGQGCETLSAIPYGKGPDFAAEGWRHFIRELDDLQAKRGMHIICLAHAHVTTYKNPDGEDFDRWSLALNEKAGGKLWRQWPEALLFFNFETRTVKSKGFARAKGQGADARLIYCTRSATSDAKNRYGIKGTLPLDFPAFMAKADHVDEGEALAELRVAIEEMLVNAPADLAAKVRAEAAKATDLARLAQIENRLSWRLDELARKADTASQVDTADAPVAPSEPARAGGASPVPAAGGVQAPAAPSAPVAADPATAPAAPPAAPSSPAPQAPEGTAKPKARAKRATPAKVAAEPAAEGPKATSQVALDPAVAKAGLDVFEQLKADALDVMNAWKLASIDVLIHAPKGAQLERPAVKDLADTAAIALNLEPGSDVARPQLLELWKSAGWVPSTETPAPLTEHGYAFLIVADERARKLEAERKAPAPEEKAEPVVAAAADAAEWKE